jgi:hypothetical protein
LSVSGLDDALKLLDDRRALLLRTEQLATDRLDIVRGSVQANQRTYEALYGALGLSDGVRRMVTADAVQLAAAEADFDASVKAREALDAVVAELRDLKATG